MIFYIFFQKKTRLFFPSFLLGLLLNSLVITENAQAQISDSLSSPDQIKKLSVEELMSIEVTSVSRRPEKLSETASAIQVITQEDIRRFGATRLPEALRLATNLEIAQMDAGQWSISARGFSSPLANKLLVMIDGRTVYSPLFAGVFWDAQEVLLEDVERIEVISGPGGTLWGANAVNGVINIITKKTKDTKGLYAEALTGTQINGLGALRYGAQITNNLHVRAYGKYSDRKATILPNGQIATDAWNMGQTGFRMDWDKSAKDVFTLQGDLYKSDIRWPARDPTTSGENVMGKWTHTFSENSEFRLQLYADKFHRNVPGRFNSLLLTYDLDAQQRFAIGKRNSVVAGGGYRQAEDDFEPGTTVFLPRKKSLFTSSLFIQDEMLLIKDKLNFTVGAKVQNNNYTGYEFQPNARLAWKLPKLQTLWAAVSRAVRMPSRLDRDLIAPPVYAGGPDFTSEYVIAYELGYRARWHERLSFSSAFYFNDYDQIRSLESLLPPDALPVLFKNGQKAESYGSELTADYRLSDWWTWRAGYTFLRINVWAKEGSTDFTAGKSESVDSEHNVTLRSAVELPWHLSLFPMYRYVSPITNPNIATPDYSELDVRIAWQPYPQLEISVAGQNLLHSEHLEMYNTAVGQKIPRNFYGRITCRF